MSPTMQLTAAPAVYTPTSDALDRHEYGVSKNRKVVSTGGGRAWSEDEEVYLLQTRLQKMPYKHIAAHLKKTELACRLHYHQLSHGSNRRKRTTSMSSGSSTGSHSPILPASIPSPIHEDSRSPSPPGSAGGYGPASAGIVQLPSIMTGASSNSSPRLPAILPKPVSMSLALATSAMGSPTASRGYPTPVSEPMPPHSAPLMPAAAFSMRTPTTATAPHSATTPSLRLDCSVLPPPPPSSVGPIDMTRLQAIYAAHRSHFWSAIAAEYGTGVNPAVLEQAWRSGAGSGSGSGSSTSASASASASCCYTQAATPITPGTSPDDREAAFYGIKTMGQGQGQDKTRISAILGIDANPRSPKERELVKRMEQERVAVPAVA